MEKFLKVLKNYYVVFSICVITVLIVAVSFGVKFVREQNNKKTALAQPPQYVEIEQPVAKPEANIEKKEENTTVDEKVVTEEPEPDIQDITEEAVDTMSIPPKDNFSIDLPVKNVISKKFSGDELVYSKTFEDYRVHRGIDIVAKRSEAVLAAADGVVEDIYTDSLEGIVIVLNHNNGFKTVYKNLSSDKMVKKGETVTQGQAISGVGETAVFEAADENHLHFELLKDDKYVDPEDYRK